MLVPPESITNKLDFYLIFSGSSPLNIDLESRLAGIANQVKNIQNLVADLK